MRTVLFVCTANICRSPMAAAIFNALAEDDGLPFRARSAGVAALEGAGLAPPAADTLTEIGVPVNPEHVARRVSAEAVADADLVLAMTPRHAEDLRRLFEAEAGKIFSLAEYVGDGSGMGISDPYGQGTAAYRASVRQLLAYLEPLVARLEAQSQRNQTNQRHG